VRPKRIAGERVVVMVGEHAGRHGCVVAPALATDLGILLPGIELVIGREGHAIVVIDAEPGRPDGRGGRGGMRACIPLDHLVDEGARVEIPLSVVTQLVKLETDRSIRECRRSISDALVSIGGILQQDSNIEQAACIRRLYKALELLQTLAPVP